MKTIYKYPLKVTDTQIMEIPAFSTMLTVQTQYKQPCLWVEVETDHVNEKVQIFTYGTGQEIKEQGIKYIGTYQPYPGLVYHVYYKVL